MYNPKIYYQYVLSAVLFFKVRFFLKSLKGDVTLPPREDMLADVDEHIREKLKLGLPIRKYHELGDQVQNYLEDLAETSQLEHLPPVLYNIYNKTSDLRKTHLGRYREVIFHRLDDLNYEMTNIMQ